MEWAKSVTTAFTLPIMILNLLSGIIGGLWLAIVGQWVVLIMGLCLIMIGSFLVNISLAPWFLLLTALSANKWLENSPPAIVILAFLSNVFMFGVMGISAIGVFWYLVNVSHATDGAVVPTLLLSYSTAVGIWSRWAQQDPSDINLNALLFHEVACVSLMVYSYYNFEVPSASMMVLWYAAPMTIGITLHVFMVFSKLKVIRQ